MSSSLALRAGTYRCGSEYPDLRSSTPMSVSTAARSGNRSLISPPRSTSNRPPSRRHMSRTGAASEKTSSVTRFRHPTWWKWYPSRIRPEPLEQVEADGPGAHLGLRAQQHCDYAARLEAGAAAHAAFVHDNDALHALFYEVEGGAETGYAGADYYDGLRSGGWHGVILWPS